MSTLTVTSIKKTGETASRDASGVSAAWVNFNGTGTVAIRDSVNVASLTDVGTGVYTINLSDNMSDTNSSLTLSKEQVSVLTDSCIYDELANRTTSSFKCLSVEGGGLADSSNVNAAIHGDLA